MTKPIDLDDISERFKIACKGLDYGRAVVLGGIVGELTTEVERLKTALIAIRTRTQGSGEGTTAGEVHKIASRALIKD